MPEKLMSNPKLVGSTIIDSIPQTGPCPLDCQECYYNGGRFYRELIPLIPAQQEAVGKIVRVNSGHDSNIQRELVIAATKDYPDKFYNTSIPVLGFGAPVVLTINGRNTDTEYISPSQVKGDLKELMFVRFRLNTWNLDLCDAAVKEWTGKGVVFVITDMRYYDASAVKKPDDYLWKQHILNSYFCLKPEELDKVFRRYSDNGLVEWCGNKETKSTYCKDCGVCQETYADTKLRMAKRAN
jgi:hypothetical protein